MTRLVAWIIDSVIIGLIGSVLFQILWRIVFPIGLILDVLLIIGISAGYFIYMWTVRRQTVGMIVMKLLVITEGTGATLTQGQAITRWMYLGLPVALVSLLSAGVGFGVFGLGGLAILLTLAPLVALAALGWQIYLAYATSQDPRKRGPHDKAANSVVVSYAPSPFAGAR